MKTPELPHRVYPLKKGDNNVVIWKGDNGTEIDIVSGMRLAFWDFGKDINLKELGKYKHYPRSLQI